VGLITTLAHKMNLRVIAEGVETPRQLERVLELGCEFGQGYYFSQPLETKAVQQFVRQQIIACKKERRGRFVVKDRLGAGLKR
jgi:EAL domain-containing protein (putative c-di-GMP-specific phosphodiesterase class I)